MRFSIFFLLSSIVLSMPVYSQSSSEKRLTGQRRYDIIVNQSNDTLSFNRGLRNLRANGGKLSNRGILTDLASSYLSLGTSSLLSASQNLLATGLSVAKEALRDKRPDWQKAANGENRFVKHLPMFTEVLDFYAEPSSIGALDPTGMKFSGFGCRQYIIVSQPGEEPHEEEVFYLSCSLRNDEHGLARMLNHSKFEVVVDELRFNPNLCNLPNDTLSIDPSTKFRFSFDKRKNLEFKVVATIRSSWINEAIQVMNDVELGNFVITAKIDPQKLDDDGVFRYSGKDDRDSGKRVTVTGDSFLVPRSFTGSGDMLTPGSNWGTGQYRVDMDISESCQINEEYYTSLDGGKRKWIKERWDPEWKMMKHRAGRRPGSNLLDIIFPQFSGDKWITTLAEPTMTILMTEEGKLVNAGAAKLNAKLGANPQSPAKSQTQANPKANPSK